MNAEGCRAILRDLHVARTNLDEAIKRATIELRAAEEREGSASVYPDPEPPTVEPRHASGVHDRFVFPATLATK